MEWLTKLWRPLTMTILLAIIIKIYLIDGSLIELTDGFWQFMEIVFGTYIVGRSGEKIMNSYKHKGERSYTNEYNDY